MKKKKLRMQKKLNSYEEMEAELKCIKKEKKAMLKRLEEKHEY